MSGLVFAGLWLGVMIAGIVNFNQGQDIRAMESRLAALEQREAAHDR